MAGLLDVLSSPAMLDISRGLLAAGKPSQVPIGTGQMIGSGLQAYQAGKEQRAQLARQAEQDDLAKRIGEAQIGKYNADAQRIVANPDGQSPMNVKEYNFWKALPSDEAREEYLTVKRANRPVDTGASLVTPSQVNPTKALSTVQKTLSPEQEPATKEKQAAATTRGTMETKSKVEAQQVLPQYIDDAEEQLALIDAMIKHPGFKYAVGKSSMLPIMPGTDAAGFMTYYDQIKGKQFMEAYKTLKGGGQITEVEGQKATQALARMDRATKEKDFISAAKEYQGIIRKGLERAKAKASVGENKRTAPGLYEKKEVGGWSIKKVK